MFIQPTPVAFAGDDINICADTSSVRLNGSITNATGGTWLMYNANGFVSDVTDLTALYTPTAADTTAGKVDLILASTGNGVCNEARDTMSIFIAPEITLDAGVDQTTCVDINFIRLAATSANTSYTKWTTTENGAFQDSLATVTNYFPAIDSTKQTKVILTLTAVDTVNGCKSKTDFLTINLTPVPVVNAGNDLNVCDGIDSIPLNGYVEN